MPSFFAWLRMAELDRVFSAPFLDTWKQSGIFGTLAILALAGAVGALAAGGTMRRRRLLQVALTLALIGSWLGWAGALYGYVGACRVVAASASRPKQSELVAGANRMAWEALIPTSVALPIILVAVVGLGLTPREKDPGITGEPAPA